MADDGPVFGIGGVLLVAKHGVAVADAVDEIEQGAQRGVSREVFGAKAGADHLLGLCDGFGSYTFDLGQGLHDPLLFILACHVHLWGTSCQRLAFS